MQDLNLVFDLLIVERKNLLKMVQDLSAEALLTVPKGYNNNIAWNLGHLMSVQQFFAYHLSGLEMNISKPFAKSFMRGTSPEDWRKTPDTTDLVDKIMSLAEKTREDYASGSFQSFSPYKTSIGVELNSFAGAMIFNGYHEGYHGGAIMAIRRALQ